MSLSNPLGRVADLIDARHDEIMTQWMKTVRRDPSLPTADELPKGELLDHLPTMLSSLADQIRGGDPGNEAARSSQVHGEYRWRQNYTLHELLGELSILREVLVAVFHDFFTEMGDFLPAESRKWAEQCLHRFLDKEIAHSVSGYVARQQEEIRTANEILREMNDRVQEFNRQLSALDEKRIQMLRTVSHELGNHLQGLTIIASVVKREADWKSTAQHLEVLSGSVNAMARLTEQLLEYTSLVSGKEYAQLRPCDLVELHTETSNYLRAMAAEKGIGFSCEIGSDLRNVQSDYHKLHRICLNLGTNAVKYTAQGSIHFAFLRLNDGTWVIEISDTGHGMTPEEQQEVFTEFYRIPGVSEAERGAGLGLPITAQLVRLLGGKIELTSEKHKGSKFQVILPVRPDVAE